jgi:hypothetical protein
MLWPLQVIPVCIFAPGGTPMNLRGTLAACALEEQLVGTWMLVSWEQKKDGGTKVQRFEPEGHRHSH